MLKNSLVRFLGLVSLLIGSAILAWIIYNVFVEEQPQFLAEHYSIANLFTPLIMIIIGLKWLFKGDSQAERKKVFTSNLKKYYTCILIVIIVVTFTILVTSIVQISRSSNNPLELFKNQQITAFKIKNPLTIETSQNSFKCHGSIRQIEQLLRNKNHITIKAYKVEPFSTSLFPYYEIVSVKAEDISVNSNLSDPKKFINDTFISRGITAVLILLFTIIIGLIVTCTKSIIKFLQDTFFKVRFIQTSKNCWQAELPAAINPFRNFIPVTLTTDGKLLKKHKALLKQIKENLNTQIYHSVISLVEKQHPNEQQTLLYFNSITFNECGANWELDAEFYTEYREYPLCYQLSFKELEIKDITEQTKQLSNENIGSLKYLGFNYWALPVSKYKSFKYRIYSDSQQFTPESVEVYTRFRKNEEEILQQAIKVALKRKSIAPEQLESALVTFGEESPTNDFYIQFSPSSFDSLIIVESKDGKLKNIPIQKLN